MSMRGSERKKSLQKIFILGLVLYMHRYRYVIVNLTHFRGAVGIAHPLFLHTHFFCHCTSIVGLDPSSSKSSPHEGERHRQGLFPSGSGKPGQIDNSITRSQNHKNWKLGCLARHRQRALRCVLWQHKVLNTSLIRLFVMIYSPR